MLTYLKRLRQGTNEDGFTLIELLVVIVIIGILAAIAVPAFLNHRNSAVQGSLESDVRNAGMVTESQNVEANDYSKITQASLEAEWKVSAGNTLKYAPNADGKGFCILGSNPQLKDKVAYDSLLGGLLTPEKDNGAGACAAGSLSGTGSTTAPAMSSVSFVTASGETLTGSLTAVADPNGGIILKGNVTGANGSYFAARIDQVTCEGSGKQSVNSGANGGFQGDSLNINSGGYGFPSDCVITDVNLIAQQYAGITVSAPVAVTVAAATPVVPWSGTYNHTFDTEIAYVATAGTYDDGTTSSPIQLNTRIENGTLYWNNDALTLRSDLNEFAVALNVSCSDGSAITGNSYNFDGAENSKSLGGCTPTSVSITYASTSVQTAYLKNIGMSAQVG